MKTNRLALLFILTLIVAASSACNVFPIVIDNGGFNMVNGSGDVITEEREVSGFDRITLSGFGQVNIEQGDEESLTVRTDDNIMPYIKTEVRGNTLVLDFTDAAKHKSFDPSNGIRFDLVVKDLSRLDVSGAGDIHVDSLETEKLTIDLSGAGNLEISDLTANELVVYVSGAGNTMVSGQVIGLEVKLSGIGNINASNLETETAILNMSGAGNGTVWVTETLDLNISGLGNVDYYGVPRVIQRITGFGKVTGYGAK